MGALIAVWIQAGIIPTIMVFGFKMISVKWFVPSVFIVCAIVGSAVGSAFTVMSTIGIAFFGIGSTLGLNPALVVGAIVSGSVFGDKMSPLSESTNLAAAIVEADLFKHIKNLMWSTVPAFIVSLILFMILGQTYANTSLTEVVQVIQVLEDHFTISIWSLLPLALMLICLIAQNSSDYHDFVEHYCGSNYDYYSKSESIVAGIRKHVGKWVCFSNGERTN